jgi:hypothetical protein
VAAPAIDGANEKQTDMKLETKLKHTPAPWEAPWKHPKRVQYSIDGGPCEDADIDPLDWVHIQVTGDAGAIAANARLIAAAPDMLDALMQATILLKHACDGHALESQYALETADAMTAAIAKAIGETQE